MKAVILAAGEGRRLDPLTRNRPKPLLPVAGRSLILRAVQALQSIGVEEACVVVSPRGEQIKEALREVKTPTIRYAVQEKPLGTAHAFLAAKSFIQDEENFILVYGDLFFQEEMLGGLVSHIRGGFRGGVLAVVQEEAKRFGVLLEEDGLLKGIVEKPKDLTGPALINSGIYVLPGEILDAAEKIEPSIRGEYELTDAISLLIKQGSRIAVYKHRGGYWLDVGTHASYLEANLLALEELDAKRSRTSATTLKGSYVGRAVRLGGGVEVKTSVLSENVEVEKGAVLEFAVLLENAVVEQEAKLSYTIIAENGTIGRESLLRGLRENPVVVSPSSRVPPYFRAGPGDVL